MSMAKTKVTERKAKMICANCDEVLNTPEDYRHHVEKCVTKNIGCDACKKTFSCRKYYLQHVRRKHANEDGVKDTHMGSENRESDWEEQSDVELAEERQNDDLIEGRIISKPTRPLPVFAPRKRRISETITSAPSRSPFPHNNKGLVKVVAEAPVQATEAPIELIEAPEPVVRAHVTAAEAPVGPRPTKIKLMCSSGMEGKLSRKNIRLQEDGEDVFFTESACKPQGRAQTFRVGDYMPLGNIDPRSIVVKLKDEGGVEIDLDYQ